MATTAERVRTHTGPAILSYGFRPFFLFGAIWAALVVAIWLPMLGGWLTLPTALTPLEWHVHELVYGYVPAIVAGFLLTAVPNWTGRLPVTGTPLLALVSIWAAGRLAVLFSARIGAPIAAAIDLLFLAGLAGVIAREIIAGHTPCRHLQPAWTTYASPNPIMARANDPTEGSGCPWRSVRPREVDFGNTPEALTPNAYALRSCDPFLWNFPRANMVVQGIDPHQSSRCVRLIA